MKRLGGGVRVGTGQMVTGQLFKCDAFSFARLIGKDHEVRDAIRKLTPDTMKMIATVPGVVNHRLKILTTLAAVIDEYWRAIGYALEVINVAYSPNRNWKSNGSRSSMLARAHEVYLSLSDPRFRIWCAFVRRLHPFSELWWGLEDVARHIVGCH
jgi:hypothetical protein